MMVGQQQAQARQLACIVGLVHLGRQPFAWRGHGISRNPVLLPEGINPDVLQGSWS